MWFEYIEAVQLRIHVTVFAHEVMWFKFDGQFLSAFVKNLRYRVVKVNYVLWQCRLEPHGVLLRPA